MMARRGPKKSRARGKRRVSSGGVGRPPGAGIERPTPESLIKKLLLVGVGNDPSQAESPATVMVARKIITTSDEHHLKDVARLWRFRYGNPSPATIRDPGGFNDHDSQRKTDSYHQISATLGKSWWPIIEIAVYQQYPRWLLAELGFITMGGPDEERKVLFEDGLSTLSRLWGAGYQTT